MKLGNSLPSSSLGSTSLRNILVVDGEEGLEEITDYNLISVSSRIDQEKVAFLFFHDWLKCS
jgi:Mg/Co/Ni transporter MgtE